MTSVRNEDGRRITWLGVFFLYSSPFDSARTDKCRRARQLNGGVQLRPWGIKTRWMDGGRQFMRL